MIDEYTGKKIVSPLDLRDEKPLGLNSNLNPLNLDATTIVSFPKHGESLRLCQSLSQAGQVQHQAQLCNEGNNK